ncbi:MAG: alkaline phosphatase family protein [Rikenellaceae bacterium]|nr:alkaline phosphatase family protein [Rikenellaceae bacterium]
MKKLLIAVVLLCLTHLATAQTTKPRLVVNLVLSGVGADDLSKYAHNMSGGGFASLTARGISYTEARYDYLQTSPIAGAATLTTGTNPSMHGLISRYWIDYTTSERVPMLDDREVRGLGCDAGQSRYSNRHVVVPTLGDQLKMQSAQSQVVTLAMDPHSAVAMGGRSDTYWFNTSTGKWNSSTAYMKELPEWLTDFNSSDINAEYKRARWQLLLPHSKYLSRVYSTSSFRIISADFERQTLPTKAIVSRDYSSVIYTPSATDITFEMAKNTLIGYGLGGDQAVDILNIGIDTPAAVGRVFGPESIEWEDALYQLDRSLADFVTFVEAQFEENTVLWVVTSSDGMSSSNRDDSRKFNPSQFKVIINGFLSAQLGRGDWVVDCIDRQVYLNRVAIYGAGLNLADVQNRVAAFAMQFRGVSHVLNATAMQNGYFGESYGRRMQNSFYPRRSGDLVLNLMPGWIENIEGEVAQSGSMYDYDTHVPLIIAGAGVTPRTIDTEVDMCSVAPTLGRLMGVGRPTASVAPVLEGIFTE